MEDERKVSMSSVNTVTAKLHDFAEELEPEERTALDMILAKATADEAEVSGFNFASFSSLNLGTPSFDLNRTQTNLRSSLLGTFCDDDNPGWELIMNGGDSQLRNF